MLRARCMAPRQLARPTIGSKLAHCEIQNRPTGGQNRPAPVSGVCQTVTCNSWWQVSHLKMRISVPSHGFAPNRCISAPHRQSGNSVDPGSNKFSNADISDPPLHRTADGWHVTRSAGKLATPKLGPLHNPWYFCLDTKTN